MGAILEPGVLAGLTATVVTFVPRILGAIIILLVGWLIGRILGRIAYHIVHRTELDRFTLETPLGDMMGGTRQAVSTTFGLIVRWFIYALAFLAAADVLAITLLSEWVSAALAYLPTFFGGLLFILFGFIVADFLGDMIERTRAATETAYTLYFAEGVRIFLYFIVIVIGLDTIGVDVELLYILAGALTTGLALAVAIGGGIAVGLGAKDYVAEHIDEWVERGEETV